MQNVSLIEKIQNLPPGSKGEVEDFVDFLTQKHAKDSSHLLEVHGIDQVEAFEQRFLLGSFSDDWDRPDMDVYDEL